MSLDRSAAGPAHPPLTDRDSLRERLRARTLLAKMNVFEKTAAAATASAENRDATFWIRKTRETYRRAIGVDPSDRDDLRRGLEAIRDHGRQRVVDLVAELAERSNSA